MDTPDLEKVKEYVRSRLEHELPQALSYHGPAHTISDVVPAAERLAKGEAIKGESLQLLLTAAWFHDIGFIETRVGHEAVSARIASEVLPGFGYSEEQLEVIKGTIAATVLPQTPASILGQILADADLDVLGRDDFMQRNADLRRELAFFGEKFTEAEWYANQVNFVGGHVYFTTTAHALRDAGQAKNLADVKAILATLGGDK
jgi:uncharacterized protein